MFPETKPCEFCGIKLLDESDVKRCDLCASECCHECIIRAGLIKVCPGCEQEEEDGE